MDLRKKSVVIITLAICKNRLLRHGIGVPAETTRTSVTSGETSSKIEIDSISNGCSGIQEETKILGSSIARHDVVPVISPTFCNRVIIADQPTTIIHRIHSRLRCWK